MTGDVDPFPFRLAAALGMTIAELGTRMSQAEFVRWRAYYTYADEMRRFAQG